MTEQADILKHKPANGEAAMMRAVVFSRMLQALCRKRLDLLLNQCDAGAFGNAAQEAVETGGSDLGSNAAVKVLICMTLHLCGLDHCSDGGPRWLIDFFSIALKETDEELPEISAGDVLARHGARQKEQMAQAVALHVCELLALPVDQTTLLEAVGEMLLGSATIRDEILLFSLSQPPAALREYLAVYS